jgi:ribose transport system substrate-binding protein
MSLNGKCGACLVRLRGDTPSRSEGRHLKSALWARFVVLVGVAAGCGGSGDSSGTPAATKSSGAAKGLVFVGFDASEVLVDAMRQGKIQGLVVQNPLRMGKLGVETMVKHLEKQAVEKQISTGETLVTLQNMNDPDVAPLIHPPQVDNASDVSLSGTKAKKYRVIVIPKGTTHEFWKTLHAGTLQAAKELGNVEVIWQGPQKEDDRVFQIQLVQNAVAAGVDGIVIAPLDSRALVEPVEAAIAKGIPVLVFDSALESTKPVSYVATNNYHGGVLAAKRLGELLKGEGRVILLRYAVGSESTEQREKGFTDTLSKEFPKIKLISDSEYAGPTSDSAQQKAQSLVTRYRGQVDGIFCPNESSTFGMLRALDGAGMLSAGP